MGQQEEWVGRRHRGESVAAIAEEAGYSHQWISRVTSPHGPFPRHPPVTEDTIGLWVADRAAGLSSAAIAQRDEVEVATVVRVTSGRGPFPRGRPLRHENDMVGVTTFAKILGVAGPTLLRWRSQGLLPGPDHVTAAGRQQWTRKTIGDWLQNHPGFDVCEQCQALTQSISHHIRAVHRSSDD